MVNVLVVDDEKDIGDFFEYFLRKIKIPNVSVVQDLEGARNCLKEENYDLVILDIKLPDGNGLDFLEEINDKSPETKVIIITGVSTIKTAVEAIKKGAFDYIEKPFENLEELEKIINKSLENRSMKAGDSNISKEVREELGFVVGENSKMHQILSVVEKVANKKITVLITGETGTGKEVLAHYIHSLSDRAYNPFVPVNCGAFAESLLESQLFGHEKGAFTDAHTTKKGVFEVANNGTLFLDEIGESSKSVQVKLLRVLDSGKFNRVGSENLISTDCRIVAATNKNLEEEVERERFRKDLFYRLNVVNLEIPPLRERLTDIPILAEHIAEKKYNRSVSFTSGTISKLKNYSWPGNIRELSNVISRALILSSDDNVIREEQLQIQEEKKNGGTWRENDKKTGMEIDIQQNYNQVTGENLEDKLMEWFQKNYSTNDQLDLNEIRSKISKAEKNFLQNILNETLKETIGDRKKAAQKLNITPRTLRYFLKEK